MATEYASQYVTGIGGNGIANAVASPDCANGCDVKVEQSYASTENYRSRELEQRRERDACGGHAEWGSGAIAI